jgi:hypothetical protein
MDEHKPPFRLEPRPTHVSAAPVGSLPGAGVEIEDEVSLLAAGKVIRKALVERPELAALLFVNPVMVLLDLGFELSPAMQRHISRRLGIDGDLAREMDELEQELREAVATERRITLTNPKHVAYLVFELLDVRPRATAGVEPPRIPVEQAVPFSGDPGPLASSEREPKLRPRSPDRPQARRNSRRMPTRRGTTIRFQQYRPTVGFIDFGADLPLLPFIDEAPAELPLEELVFYRDDHPLIPKLCRYQALHRRRLAFATPEQYRRIRDGELGSMWRSWIDGASFTRK